MNATVEKIMSFYLFLGLDVKKEKKKKKPKRIKSPSMNLSGRSTKLLNNFYLSPPVSHLYGLVWNGD